MTWRRARSPAQTWLAATTGRRLRAGSGSQRLDARTHVAPWLEHRIGRSTPSSPAISSLGPVLAIGEHAPAHQRDLLVVGP
jgi:hypothetical protein